MDDNMNFVSGNEAVAISAIKSGLDKNIFYPITPSTEVGIYINKNYPNKFFQTSSEMETAWMMYGIASHGGISLTATSGCGLSLMREMLSYACGAHLPMVIVDVMRFGPGLGGITPSTQDILTAKASGHGMSEIVGLTPVTVQDLYDFIPIAFELAFKHRVPVMIFADAILGQMYEGCDVHDIKLDINWDGVNKWCINNREEGHKITSRSKVTSFRLSDGEQGKQIDRLLNKMSNIKFDIATYDKLKPESLIVCGKPVLSAIGTTARSVKKAAEVLGIGHFIPKTVNPFGYNLSPRPIITVEVGGNQLSGLFAMAGNNNVRSVILPNSIPTPNDIIKEVKNMCY